MTDLGTVPHQVQQHVELTSKIITVYDLLADPALEIPH